MENPPLVELHRVSYAHARTAIIRRLSWQVCAGERWAVLGPNGAGKTTLLRLAFGELWPNRGGSIRRMGSDAVDLREFHCRVGWVTAALTRQIPADEPVLRTVVSGKFAQTGLWEMFWDPPTRADYARARRYLAMFDCGRFAHRTFGELSQGEQQKVLIARALMADPLLIILDEPCAGLDPAAREQFLAGLDRFARHASPALVYVTHHLEEIMPSFDRVLLLGRGTAVAAGSARRLLTAANLRRLYGLPVRLLRRHGRAWMLPA
ncbi:MAG TPA: ATP-binding cassette domain-containing protein [bacterium]|nr:ATP-binding cassette domain-containing protein [bacterium]